MCQSKFVVVFVGGGVDAESDEGEALTRFLRHDYETELGEGVGEVICCACEVRHDGSVAMLAETDELVVLADDLGSSFREIEGEGSLIGAEVVNVEYELLGKVFWGTPDDPSNTRVDKSVPVVVSSSF